MRTVAFRHDQLDFVALDEGPLDGPPVVLLHGFPQDAACFDAVVPLLNARGLRTLRFDQRGYAEGARPRAVAAYRGSALTGDVLALADQAGLDRFHLVGHDWGGGIARLVAQRAPERLASLTVLSTPHPAALRQAFLRSDQLRRSWYMGAFQLRGLAERFLAPRMQHFLLAAGMGEDDAHRYATRFADPSSLVGPMNWYRAIHRGSDSLLSGTGRIHVPTTFVWGNQDVALGRWAAEHTAQQVAADYGFVELDATHWLPEQEPRAVAAAVVDHVTAHPR